MTQRENSLLALVATSISIPTDPVCPQLKLKCGDFAFQAQCILARHGQPLTDPTLRPQFESKEWVRAARAKPKRLPPIEKLYLDMLEYEQRTCAPRLRGRFFIKTLTEGGARLDLDGDGALETIELVGQHQDTLSVNGKRIKLMRIERVSVLPTGKSQLLIVDSGQDGQIADYRIVRWANGRLRPVGPLLSARWNPYLLEEGRLGFLNPDCGAFNWVEYEVRRGRLIKVVDRTFGQYHDDACVN